MKILLLMGAKYPKYKHRLTVHWSDYMGLNPAKTCKFSVVFIFYDQ
jgi:hypothetical protein